MTEKREISGIAVDKVNREILERKELRYGTEILYDIIKIMKVRTPRVSKHVRISRIIYCARGRLFLRQVLQCLFSRMTYEDLSCHQYFVATVYC